MSLLARRRAMMGAKSEPKTPIYGPCTEWYYRTTGSIGIGGTALSDDSFYLINTSGWDSYAYARPANKTYNQYVGKTIVIDFTNDKTLNQVGLGVMKRSTFSAGISEIVERKAVKTNIQPGTHKFKTTIGTDYIITNDTYKARYLTVYAYAHSETSTERITMKNVKCYVEGE